MSLAKGKSGKDFFIYNFFFFEPALIFDVQEEQADCSFFSAGFPEETIFVTTAHCGFHQNHLFFFGTCKSSAFRGKRVSQL